jgi:hypothetical protein
LGPPFATRRTSPPYLPRAYVRLPFCPIALLPYCPFTLLPTRAPTLLPTCATTLLRCRPLALMPFCAIALLSCPAVAALSSYPSTRSCYLPVVRLPFCTLRLMPCCPVVHCQLCPFVLLSLPASLYSSIRPICPPSSYPSTLLASCPPVLLSYRPYPPLHIRLLVLLGGRVSALPSFCPTILYWGEHNVEFSSPAAPAARSDRGAGLRGTPMDSPLRSNACGAAIWSCRTCESHHISACRRASRVRSRWQHHTCRVEHLRAASQAHLRLNPRSGLHRAAAALWPAGPARRTGSVAQYPAPRPSLLGRAAS